MFLSMDRFEELCFEIDNIFIEIEELQYNIKLGAIKFLEEKISALKLICDIPTDIPVKDFLEDIGDEDIINDKISVHEEEIDSNELKHNIPKKILGKGQMFICQICDKHFATKETLRKHSINKHSHLRLFKCDKCDKTFKDPTSCKRHAANEKLHQKDYTHRTLCSIVLGNTLMFRIPRSKI